MSENTAVEVDPTAEETATKKAGGPKGPRLTAPSSAHKSLADYVNANSDQSVTPDQVMAMLVLHNKWQSSPERKTEREAEKAQNAELAEAKKAANAEKAAAKKIADAEAKAKKDAKDKAKAAKASEGDDDLDDLDAEDDDLDAEATPAPSKRRSRKGKSEPGF